MSMHKQVLALVIFLAAMSSSTQLLAAAPDVDPFANPPVPAFAGQTAAPAPTIASAINQEVIATGFNLPRSLVVLPDGNLLVTEGAGTVRILSPEGKLSEPLPGMPDILS